MEKQITYSENGCKYRLKISKTGCLKFISHLDWQKLIYYSIKKAGLKLNYSQGFNPAPKISIGVALPLFIEGKNEYVDIEFQEEIDENIIKDKLNNILPENSQISNIVKIPKNKDCLEKTVCWAVYKAFADQELINKKINIESLAKELLLKENIIIEKSSKKGLKKIDIKPGIYSLQFDSENNILEFILKAGIGNIQENNISDENNGLLLNEKVSISSVRADEFVKILTPEINWRITREKLLDCNFNELMN
ncbi:MAG TPA: TIGR03936 family radical SAM-associated protein [Candidatus Gastranaerophilales bacterium]|nr:TIGR03936 family radical SAM-associated protein [Candidatus Gastranaerophilales bacterium]